MTRSYFDSAFWAALASDSAFSRSAIALANLVCAAATSVSARATAARAWAILSSGDFADL
jgi:hypothetical protein